MPHLASVVCLIALVIPVAALGQATTSPTTDAPAVRFNTNFEGASLGKVEVLSSGVFRCFVPGQYNERGRNRQTSWFYFRMDGVRGRELTLTMTDLVGEYNERPGAVPYGPGIVPVFSPDGRRWTHVDGAAVSWDADRKEMTFRITPESDCVWVAHAPPYTPADLRRLLDEIDGRSPHARVESIGRTVNGRDIQMVTVTDAAVPKSEKTCVWLQSRQHAWESGTSWVMEGALRFITSDDPAAAELRRRVVFRFTPMVDVDGCATGKVRFNANGFDVNRHWPTVDLVSKDRLREMPEIWYTKKAIVSAHALGPPIALFVNMHNTETAEYLATQIDGDAPAFAKLSRLESRLIERGQFNPSRKLERPRPSIVPRSPQDTTNSLWPERRIPVALMELRVSKDEKLGRQRTVDDWQTLGRELIQAMAASDQ